MSSPDVRVEFYELDLTRTYVFPDPFWPELAFTFPVSPEDLHDWATKIFFASEFLELFDGVQK